MSREPMVAELHGVEVESFLYPDAPKSVALSQVASLFREAASESAADLHPTPGRTAAEERETGTESERGLRFTQVAVQYEYRPAPGYKSGYKPGFESSWTSEFETAGEFGWGSGNETGEPQDQGSPPPDTAGNHDEMQHFEKLLVSECRRAEELGRQQGLESGLAQGRSAGIEQGREEAVRQLHAGVEGERKRLFDQVTALLKSFAEARENYVHRLEQESAKLALAIAARILRREAESDPLVLTGAVRVALGQLAAKTAVRLYVPAQDLTLWEEALSRLPGLPIRPEVVGDPQLGLGECRMETSLGSADLGLWPQWKAVERGFFERAQGYTPDLTPDLRQDLSQALTQDFNEDRDLDTVQDLTQDPSPDRFRDGGSQFSGRQNAAREWGEEPEAPDSLVSAREESYLGH